MRHIIFLLDSTDQCCPRKPRNSHHGKQNQSQRCCFASPLSKNKSPTTGPRREFLFFSVILDSQANNLSVPSALLPRVAALCPSRQRTRHLFQEALLDHPLWLDRLPLLWPVFCQSVHSVVSCLESSSAGSVISTSQHLMQGLAWRRQPSVMVEYESCLTGGTHCCIASAHKFPITSPWILTQS